MSGGKCLGELLACCRTGSPGGVVQTLERKLFDSGTSHVPVGGFPRLRHQQKVRNVDLDGAGFPLKFWGVHCSADKFPPRKLLGRGYIAWDGIHSEGISHDSKLLRL